MRVCALFSTCLNWFNKIHCYSLHTWLHLHPENSPALNIAQNSLHDFKWGVSPVFAPPPNQLTLTLSPVAAGFPWAWRVQKRITGTACFHLRGGFLWKLMNLRNACDFQAGFLLRGVVLDNAVSSSGFWEIPGSAWKKRTNYSLCIPCARLSCPWTTATPRSR